MLPFILVCMYDFTFASTCTRMTRAWRARARRAMVARARNPRMAMARRARAARARRAGRAMAREARRTLRPLLRLRRPGRWTRTGTPWRWGDTVMRHATKHKDKYDKRKAKVERLNATVAVITQCSKALLRARSANVDYNSIEVCALQTKLVADGATSGEYAAAVVPPQNASPSALDADCVAIFGNLEMMW